MAPRKVTGPYTPTHQVSPHVDGNSKGNGWGHKKVMEVVRQEGRPQFLVPRGMKKPPLVARWKKQDRLILELGRRRGMADEARDAQNTAELEAAIGVDPPWEESSEEEEEDSDDENDEEEDDQDGGGGAGQKGGDDDNNGAGGPEDDGVDHEEWEEVSEGDEEKREGEAAPTGNASTMHAHAITQNKSKAPNDATTPAQSATHATSIINPTTVESEAAVDRTGTKPKLASTVTPTDPDEEDNQIDDNDIDMDTLQDGNITYPTIPNMKADLTAWGVSRHGARVLDTLRPIWLAAYRARVARGDSVDATTRPGAKKAGKLAVKPSTTTGNSLRKSKETEPTKDQSERQGAQTAVVEQDVDIEVGGPKTNPTSGHLKITKRSLTVKLKYKVPSATKPNTHKRKQDDEADERPAKRPKAAGTDVHVVVEGTAVPPQTAQEDVDTVMGGTEVAVVNEQSDEEADVVMTEPLIPAPVEGNVQVASKTVVPQTRKAGSKQSTNVAIAKPATGVTFKKKTAAAKQPKQPTPEGTRKSNRNNKSTVKMTELPTVDEDVDMQSQDGQTDISLPAPLPKKRNGKVADDALQEAMWQKAKQNNPGMNKAQLTRQLGWLSKKADDKPLDYLTDIEAGLVPRPPDTDECVYEAIGTHVVGDYLLPPHPEFDHLIPNSGLNSHEQRQRRRLAEEKARKAAKDAGVEYVDPDPPVKKWDWREHHRKPGELRRPYRFDNMGRWLGKDGKGGDKPASEN